MSNSKKKPSDSGLFKISQSKVSKWRQCRQAYHYAHVEKIAPKKKARPLKFGSIVHELVETDINGKNPFKALANIAKTNEKLFDAEREMYGEIVKDVGYIMTHYFDYWDNRPESIEYLSIGKLKCEHPFEVEIADGILAKGRIDAIGKAKKLKWLVEHKSHKAFPKPENRWRNLQSVFYIRIVEMMGWGKLDGTCWDYIRSKPPTRPAILKSGEMSRAALDSLPGVVMDVLKQNKLKSANYAEVIKQQEENQATWFQRVFTPVSKDIIQPVMDDLIDTSREMSELHGKSKTKTFGRHCEWCGYRELCAAELQGHDVDFIKERGFEENEYEAEEPVEE
jgi:hypothetical protein